MTTETLKDARVDPATGEPVRAHILAPDNGRSGVQLAMEARLHGTPVNALCGHVFVPQHDPRQLPDCQRCVEIFEGKFGPGQEPPDA